MLPFACELLPLLKREAVEDVLGLHIPTAEILVLSQRLLKDDTEGWLCWQRRWRCGLWCFDSHKWHRWMCALEQK